MAVLACFALAQERVTASTASEPSVIYICPMHPEVQTPSIGKCPRCKMSLVAVPVTPGRVSYSCPTHPGFVSAVPGVCWRCGAALLPTASLSKYRVDIKTTPLDVHAGTQTTMQLTVYDPQSGALVNNFNTVHEKLFHLFVISQDLAHYQHIHPIQQPDGTFVVQTVFPEEGNYYIVSDFSPGGGWPQIVRRTLVTVGAKGTTKPAVSTVVPDTVLDKTVDGVRFKLKLEPGKSVAGVPTVLRYDLTDSQTGLPVSDLEPYLGAWGHTVIMSEDGQDYVHSHPQTSIRRNGPAKLMAPPAILFDSFFPRPGRYRIWSQIQRHKKVTTVSFDLDVARLDALALWNGKSWSALEGTTNTDLNGSVRALAVSGKNVYAGGDFTNAGTLQVNRIVKWDGHKWSALGQGVNGTVWAIAAAGEDLYVAGEFTTAGGISANRVAKWDGRRWSALGEGVRECRDSSCSPAVYALAFRGKDLYAGGRFLKAGTRQVNGVARWGSNGWVPLGEGVRTGVYDGVVRALAVDGPFLYAGGSFKTAGHTTVNNIAKWNARQWEALDSGIGGGLEQVLAVAVQGEELYAGGDFTVAGGAEARNAAVWNGRKWSGTGFQTEGAVQAITVDKADTYMAGSRFTLPSGQVVQGVIKGNSIWSAVGSGVGNGNYLAPVMALGIARKELFIGGGPFALPNTTSSVSSPLSRGSVAQ